MPYHGIITNSVFYKMTGSFCRCLIKSCYFSFTRRFVRRIKDTVQDIYMKAEIPAFLIKIYSRSKLDFKLTAFLAVVFYISISILSGIVNMVRPSYAAFIMAPLSMAVFIILLRGGFKKAFSILRSSVVFKILNTKIL